MGKLSRTELGSDSLVISGNGRLSRFSKQMAQNRLPLASRHVVKGTPRNKSFHDTCFRMGGCDDELKETPRPSNTQSAPLMLAGRLEVSLLAGLRDSHLLKAVLRHAHRSALSQAYPFRSKAHGMRDTCRS